MLEWPYRRFLKAFDAWQRRRAVDDCERRKQAHIAALHSNQTWDDKENNRPQAIENLEEHYEQVKDMIWSSSDEVKEEIVETDNAFMRAGKRALARIVPPEMPGESSVGRLVSR